MFQELAIPVLRPNIRVVGVLSVRWFIYSYTEVPPFEWACFLELWYSSELQMYKISYMSETFQLHKRTFMNCDGLKHQSALKIACNQMVFIRVLETVLNLGTFKLGFSLHVEFVWGLVSVFTQLFFHGILFLPKSGTQVVKKIIACLWKNISRKTWLYCGCSVAVQVLRCPACLYVNS